MTHYRFDDDGNELPPVLRTITEINYDIKSLIEEEVCLQDFYAVGEISNFKKHSTGHFYLTLKDETSEIRAVMFKTYAQRVKFKPENGLRVIVHARIGVYPVTGSYQMYIDSMQPDGIGDLQLAFEQLKRKLENEGLFDNEHKKSIPDFPKVIGIITSPTGAAVRDIIKVTSTRCPCVKLVLYPSLVQGMGAAEELTKGIEYFNITESVDTIIIGRGGGSYEDLWAFNDESLARAIYKSKIPVISAVGHEIDFTICDFVADLRAATPSHAAELATPNLQEIKNGLKQLSADLVSGINNALVSAKNRLKDLSASRVLTKPLTMLDIPKLKLASCEESLAFAMKNLISDKKYRFADINAKLVALNPMAVISRGYGAIFNEEKKVIKSVADLKIGDIVDIRLSDGQITAQIQDKKGID